MKIGKKALSVFLCLVIVLGTVALSGDGLSKFLGVFSIKATAGGAGGEYDIVVGNYLVDIYYSFYDEPIAVIHGFNPDISENPEILNDIPTMVRGVPITEITGFNNTDIKKIAIPEGFTRINDGAFENCANLTEISLPETLESIGKDAFLNTGFYNDESNWEDNVLYLYDCLIAAKSNISGEYAIKNGTTKIANEAFNNCSALTEVIIPGSVANIGSYTFSFCTALETAEFLNGIKNTGTNTFYRCTELHTVNFPNTLTTIGAGCFTGCSKLERIELPASLAQIDSYAFWYSGLKNIKIPTGVTIIESQTFDYCENLESVELLGNVRTIDTNAFSNCPNLTTINFPNSITSIGCGAFESCTKLTNISLGDNITSIGLNAFKNTGYYNDENNWDDDLCLYINNYLIELNKYYCYGTYHIKSGTKLIASYAFGGCSRVDEVSIPSSVTTICEAAFEGSGIKKITIPNSVINLESNAFQRCRSLETVEIGNGVNKIEEYSFDDCEKLSSVKLGSNVTSIGESAFSGCTNLKHITIPGSVLSIKAYAFEKCGLTEIEIPDNVINVASSAFSECKELETATIGDGLNSTLNDSTIIIGSLGSNIFPYCPKLVSIKVKSGNQTYHSLDNCLIETASKTIISGCKASIIPCDGSVTTIESYSFLGCIGLEKIDIPRVITSIEPYAFKDAGLTEIIIPNASIGYGAFDSCTNLKKAEIGSGVNNIDSNPFVGCIGLDEIIVDGINQNYYSSDNSCIIETRSKTLVTGCKNTVIPSDGSVTSIGDSAFGGLYNLKSITIPYSIKSIGGSAFFMCDKYGVTSEFKDVYYAGSESDRAQILIDTAWGGNDELLNATWHYNFNFDACSHSEIISRTLYPATCTDNGWEMEVCRICGKPSETIISIPAKGHTFGDWETEYSQSGSETGYLIIKCSECGFVKERKQISSKTTITDTVSGIELEINDINSYDNIKLEVREVPDSTFISILDLNSNDHAKVFDIKIVEDGREIQPKDRITVKIPFPENYDRANTYVYHINTDTGLPEFIKYDIIDGYIVFETEHFSYYAVVERNNPTVSAKLIVPSNTEVEYAATVTVKAKATGVPEGYFVALYDGNTLLKKGSNTEVSYTFPGEFTGTKNITAKIIDDNGNVQKDGNGNDLSASFEVKAKSGFFAKLIAFFKRLFRLLPSVTVEPK